MLSSVDAGPDSHDDDGDASSSSSMSSTGTLVPDSAQQTHSFAGPSSWSAYFDQELFLHAPTATYHAYLTPPKSISKDPLFVCHHGAGSSGLSFALFASHVRKLMPSAGILSIDARNHGLTVDAAEPNAPSDMSGDTQAALDYSLALLSDDLVHMIRATQAKLSWPSLPSLMLVGHSLGGAVVTDVAKSGVFGAKLVGFAVLDVVEGSAMDALKSMQALLAARPSSFASAEDAIDWHIRSRTIRSPSSARVTVPSLFRETDSGRFVWRTDLAGTKSFWRDWFTGMSKNFLAGKAAKLLILAGTDRLDKDLMIGQMQGKFQLQVFPESGHYVQEDQPEKTAEVVTDFFKRNDRGALVLPPKVSDLIAQGKKV